MRRLITGAACVVAVAAAMPLILRLDRAAARFCAELPTTVTAPMSVLTEAGDSLWYFVILVPLAAFFHFVRRRRRLRDAAVFLTAAIAGSGILVNLIKPLVGRARPTLFLNEGFFGLRPLSIGYETNSFPSGHASTITALTFGLALLVPRARWVLLPFGLLVALSRVSLNHHFLSDVAAGIVLTVVFTLALRRWLVGRGFQLTPPAATPRATGRG